MKMKSDNMQKISVCMAVFNGEKYLHEQISSILAQLKQGDELIISDDASTDATLNVARSFGDARIKIHSNSLDQGYSGNFENAISLASGDVIFLADQDDVWLEGRVGKMLAALAQAQLVVCNARFTDEHLQPLATTLFSLRGGKQGFIANLYKSRYLGACMAFKSEILPKLLPFPVRRALCPHDLWITLVAELYYKVTLIDEPLMLYRRHGANASSGGMASGNSLYGMLEFRCYSLFKVLSRAAQR